MPSRSKDSALPLISEQDIEQTDVLLGRGKATFKHPGNVAYRALIDSRLQEYFKGDRNQKGGCVIDMIRSVKDTGSRFLRKKGAAWEEVDVRAAREKIGHSIRDTMKASKHFKFQDEMRQLFDETSSFEEILAFVIKKYNIICHEIGFRGPCTRVERNTGEAEPASISVADDDTASLSSASESGHKMEIEDVPSPTDIVPLEVKSNKLLDRRRSSSCKRASLVRDFISKLDDEIERIAIEDSFESLRYSNQSLCLTSLAKIDEWIDVDDTDSGWSELLMSLNEGA